MIIISACLAGTPCRWDGIAKPDKRIIEMVKAGKAIPVCPEQLGGLPTPRDPSEIANGRVISKKGTDVTAQFDKGAQIVLRLAKLFECKEAILKSRSPSCGSGKIYDGTFSGNLVSGDGITARLLKDNGITVHTEEDNILSGE
ncbi:MAG TPA: DUF523 domain-containing protein [bacterium]|nr:DUF523 domain-containing protein [bacterium]HPS31341.1 DUF523 domain-containing protein [bacterium]